MYYNMEAQHCTSHVLLYYIIVCDRHPLFHHFLVYVCEIIIYLQTIMLGKI
jgi:hypothetical protein